MYNILRDKIIELIKQGFTIEIFERNYNIGDKFLIEGQGLETKTIIDDITIHHYREKVNYKPDEENSYSVYYKQNAVYISNEETINLIMLLHTMSIVENRELLR